MAVSELLIQSVDGIIRLFPAWPKELDAEFWNLRTVGGFLVSGKLEDREIRKVEIRSTAGGEVRLLRPEGWNRVKIIGKNGAKIEWISEGTLIRFQTEERREYTFMR